MSLQAGCSLLPLLWSHCLAKDLSWRFLIIVSIFRTHSRAGFAYLRLALHQFKLARKQQKKTEGSDHLHFIDYEDLAKEVEASAAREKKSRFERVSPDLFLKLFSFADAPSLLKSMSVSKAWKDSIDGSSERFRNFRMEGKGEQICKGLQIFSQRSKESIRRMELEFDDNLDPPLRKRLVNLIKKSSKSLRFSL